MRTTTSKIIVIFCLINGVLWVWSSYILAYFGRTEIAENLSQVAITQMIAVVLIYSLKALFENLAKNNDWLDKSDSTSKRKNRQDCE